MIISDIQVHPIHYPMRGFFKFFPGGTGKAVRPTVVVRIETDDGLVGWGQAVPVPTWSYETLEAALAVLRNSYIPALIGHDPSDLEGAQAKMDRATAPAFSTGMPITRAGIDIALHDLAAKSRRLSLPEFWGRPGLETIPLSWTVNVDDLDRVHPTVAEGLAAGYARFNLKVGTDPDFDLELVRLVRELVPDTPLWADANCGYEQDEALRMAPKLADAGVALLESPLPPNRIGAYRELKALGALPIYMDEGVVSPIELEEFIRLDMCDGVAMKPARCGGLLSCKRQIETIERYGLAWVGSGLCDPDISLAASLALFGAYGLRSAAALNGPQLLRGTILKTPVRVRDGSVQIPKGPGLGVEPDPERLARAAAAGKAGDI